MRTKEVEEAIDRINAFIEDNLYRIGGIQGFSIKGGVEKGLKTEQLKTVLSYIETLEELPNKIRDKIKEYEKKIIEAREEDDDNKELYYEQEIEVLKSIIGE